MFALRRVFFGSAGRRWLSFFVTNAVFLSAAFGIHHFLDNSCGSPGLSFFLVAVWMTLGILTALITVISLGDFFFDRGFSGRFLRDEMADLDARIDGRLVEDPDIDDVIALSGDSNVRFWLYFMAACVVYILGTNRMSHGFLQRYTHPGVAVIHMRSDVPAVRRRGLDMLVNRLDFTASPAVEEVVTQALLDSNDGVIARAAFVAAQLKIDSAAPRLGEISRTNEALTFVTMIALGQLGGAKARATAKTLIDDPIALTEPHALAFMLGLLRVRGIERLRALYEGASDDETLRVAAVWALGRLNEPRLLNYMADRLKDSSLAVRCAATSALETMVVYEAAAPLKKAFEAVTDREQDCPEITIPVQEDGQTIVVVQKRSYQLALLRALASTDDPALLKWLVIQQENVVLGSKVHTFMRLKWEDMKKKDADGRLNRLKLRIRQRDALKIKAPDAESPQVDGGRDDR